MKLKVYPKERFYLFLMFIVSAIIYAMLILSRIGIMYLLIATIFAFFAHGIFIGSIRGNSIRVSDKQFPEVYKIAKDLSQKIGFEEVPSIYIMQSGGMLNAFATKFLGRNFVIIYSDVLELAYKEGEPAVAFIIAHELAHIKRKHLTWRGLLYPAMLVPLLGPAYSRACEYTSDLIAAQLVPEGAIQGLTVLATGKRLYQKLNILEVINQSEEESGFWIWLSEKFSNHPNLIKRINRVYYETKVVIDSKGYQMQ
ncbi:M48 family metallopeptidase [Caloranaerobacter azorensis]|uniref:M48 family metallopeptidase n=1 Tax=Caloranaerobacter azorensis TaxID=116090 RepID=A0A6P1YBZ1_9FIRM|nr:M48 family metallopeptidase [Caloranaerobacter azorensis]QIB26819.1 M48 family metallopeptidase [Caloranaerobacter azorensis]